MTDPSAVIVGSMTTTIRIATGAAAVVLASLLTAGLSGCSAKVENKTAQPMSAADLQKKLTDQFAATPSPPKSVSCKEDLGAAVGKTATCVVALDDTASIDAVVTVTDAKGSELSYDIMPEYTKDQLATVVSGMVAGSAATCATGLEGKIGATAQCETTLDGVVAQRVLQVDNVSNLQMDLSIKRLWPKEKVQEVLMQKLNADGTPAETVECVDGVEAQTGADVECVAVTGSQKKGYVVTVTTFDEDSFDLDYKDAP